MQKNYSGRQRRTPLDGLAGGGVCDRWWLSEACLWFEQQAAGKEGPLTGAVVTVGPPRGFPATLLAVRPLFSMLACRGTRP